jgi:hypothetical protein
MLSKRTMLVGVAAVGAAGAAAWVLQPKTTSRVPLQERALEKVTFVFVGHEL